MRSEDEIQAEAESDISVITAALTCVAKAKAQGLRKMVSMTRAYSESECPVAVFTLTVERDDAHRWIWSASSDERD